MQPLKIEELTPAELHYSLGKAVMGEIAGNWEASKTGLEKTVVFNLKSANESDVNNIVNENKSWT